ncbi:MAG: hypothetical protein EZS28_038793 [Streblomastix strix]|uniref:Uncharacterized protein n=1 Tax=Streblomastix strix TaxID=222440 RepID=A0A5J4U640_9EUKA|nr:MAG: hypothetical protein EZS28_038793 [Streblomastix strix]
MGPIPSFSCGKAKFFKRQKRPISDLRRKLSHLRDSLDIQRLLREIQIQSIVRRIEQEKHQNAVNRRSSLNAAQKTLTVSGELPEKPKVANVKNTSLNAAHKNTNNNNQGIDSKT